MSLSIDLLEQPAIPALTVRRRSAVENLPATLGVAYSEIMSYAGQIGARVKGPAFVIYYNMDMADLDIEIGFICENPTQGNGIVVGSEIRAGLYVEAMHTGPYSAMIPLYEAMSAFMAEKGLVPTGEAIEFYYNSPMEVPENELKTKIWMGVQP